MGRVVRTVAKIAGVVALVATGAGAVFGAVEAAIGGFPARAPLLLLGAIFAATLALCPWGAAAGLRQALE